VRAFFVLAHAEIESCVEDLAADIADRAYTQWATRRRVNRCLIALIAFDTEGFPGPAVSLTQPLRKQAPGLRQRVEAAYRRHATYLRTENHGVKERNLLRILLPVGIRETDLDTSWLNHMNGFGASRGSIAHSSAKAVRQPPDNADVRRAVADVLGTPPSFGLRNVDDLLVALR
jgi:hypothetical protein